MNRFAITAALLMLTSAAYAQLPADTPVSDEQFLKSCATTAKADPGPYCACVALEITKAATSERELLIGRQVIASMDSSFGYPLYMGDDQKIYLLMEPKVLEATRMCGSATLNADGTVK